MRYSKRKYDIAYDIMLLYYDIGKRKLKMASIYKADSNCI